VTRGNGTTAPLWDVNSGKELRRLTGHSRSVLGVAFSSDGRRAVTCSTDFEGAVKVWDVGSGRGVRSFNLARNVSSVAFSPDGRRLLWGDNDGFVQLWDAESGKAVWSFTGHERWVNSVAFSHDGRRAVSGGADKTVRLWSLPK
jgi:WD40 repeat protein